ncbi:MAG TPA: DUF1054 family protein [Chthonomonadales bacterium]|nr:DUF1054 family protein [Chthonomonadales bacterium]
MRAVQVTGNAVPGGDGFHGFRPEDFAVFEIPGFAPRMTALRSRVSPKLTALGAYLQPALCELTGETLYAHVAQHLRRTVNPPVETWVAFARSARAYKPFIHFRVAINAASIRTVVFVEDDADDKPLFATNLSRNAPAITRYLGQRPFIQSYELAGADGRPLSGPAFKSARIKEFAGRLARVKGQHASFGCSVSRQDECIADGCALAARIVEYASDLLPLFRFGSIEKYRIAYPEPLRETAPRVSTADTE